MVIEVVKTIPKGKTMTYGEVAAKAGYPAAARAVGNTVMKNFDPDIPCHRVVPKNGIGEYNGGREMKIQLLRSEGAI